MAYTYPHRRSNERGAISVAVIVMTLILALTASLMLRIGLVGEELNNERLLVDFHGKLVGRIAISAGLNETCSGGQLTGRSQSASQELERALNEGGANRRFRCDVEGELIERRGGPESQRGSFRVFRVSSASDLDLKNDLTRERPGAQARERHQEDEVLVEVREEQGNVERRRAKLVFVLDYSASMRGNRIRQLKRGVQHFVSANYPMDYGVILFNSRIIGSTRIGRGAAHARRVMEVVNNNDAGGNTMFHGPLELATEMLRAQRGQDLFIILMSDGEPDDGGAAQHFVQSVIRNVPAAACTGGASREKCITVYTLGVDDADLRTLRRLSGNAVDPGGDYNYDATAGRISAAFDHIIANILCRYGPLVPGPTRAEEETLNVFLRERPLSRREYSYDRENRQLQFFNSACNQVLNGGGQITIRYGEPRVYMSQR